MHKKHPIPSFPHWPSSGCLLWVFMREFTMLYIAAPHCIKLTHWGRMTHICFGNLTIIGSDNGLSPGRQKAIIWTNDGILLIGPLGTNFSEILVELYIFSLKKMHLKLLSGNWRPFCLGLNVLTKALLSTGDLVTVSSDTLNWAACNRDHWLTGLPSVEAWGQVWFNRIPYSWANQYYLVLH